MIKYLKNIRLSHYTVLMIGVAVIWVSSNYNWGDGLWKGILKSDGTGYYAYLPAVFIYDDLNYKYYDSLRDDTTLSDNLDYEFRVLHNGRYLNKYYCGTALAQLPFFGLGHFANYIRDLKLDGYSYYYQIFIQIGTIFYLLVSLLVLNKLLKYYNVSDLNKAIVLIAIVFATNIFHYTVSEPGKSHIYSLFFISLFLLFQKRYFTEFKSRWIILTSLALGMIVLIRPVNMIILFSIPFIAGTRYNLTKGLGKIFKHPLTLFLSVMSFLIIISFQAIIYKIGTGDFFVYSYKGESFLFFQPHFLDILFSYRKGLFVYTPVLFLVLIIGIFKLFLRDPYQAIYWLLFFIIVTYMLSSWHQWYYGGSFSSRVYIEYYPLFAILMGISLQTVKKPVFRKLLITVIFILIVVCQIQTYQYKVAQMHWSDMNKELYWKNFLRIDKVI